MTAKASFTGYKWAGLETYDKDSPWHDRAYAFFVSIDWNALCQFTSKLRMDEPCIIDSQLTMGANHMIRVLKFADCTRWVARLRMPSMDPDDNTDNRNVQLQREVDCIQLIRERTTMPVPAVYGYIASADNAIGAPFMLMECLAGNVAVDLDNDVPSQHKASFYAEMANYQTETSSITFPKIGQIIRLQDGTYDVGPLEGLGGPFDTATEFLKAWVRETEFRNSMDNIEDECGEDSDEIAASIREFPLRLEQLATNIAIQDHGPFPLFNNDFGHNNIVVNDNYKTLGVIDWENAHSVPWEIVDFPILLQNEPAPLAESQDYDENGVPRDKEARAMFEDQKRYIDAVRQAEQSKRLPPMLSAVLADRAGQDLATSMQLYSEGRWARYAKVFDVHHERWAKKQGETAALISDKGMEEDQEKECKHPSTLWGVLSA